MNTTQESSTKRRPRKIDRSQPPDHASRPTSTSASGGVRLPSNTGSTSPAEPASSNNARPSHSKNRRRPKKLNREASTTANPIPEGDGGLLEQKQENDISREISALRARVGDIETQVREMIVKMGQTAGKPSRRRLRKNKVEPGETDAEELERLRSDLVNANRELELLKRDSQALTDNNRVSDQEEMDEEDDEIEEIPRSNEDPLARPGPNPMQRSLTFSGSYRINLPSAVSDSDLKAVQTGLSGVQNIARKVIAEAQVGDQSISEASEVHGTRSGSGWSSWFGGYSLSIARFVNNMHVEGNDQGRAARSRTEPMARRRPPKLRIGNGSSSTAGPRNVKGAEGLLS
jgi:hypothetical protein